MSDDPMDKLPSYDRVSIRAVLVADGEDPREALAAAGIFDPVAIPVIPGDDSGLLGDTVTPNLAAVLEPDEADDWGHSVALPPTPTHRAPSAPVARMLPEAFGQRPFAPVVSRPRN